MEEDKGKRSKYSMKQKKYILDSLTETEFKNINLSVEDVLEIPYGIPLYPDVGFDPLYRSFLENDGSSYHMPAINGMTYLFAICELMDIFVLPNCDTKTEIEWIAKDVLEIRFRFYTSDGSYYLGLPFIFSLGGEGGDVGVIMHRSELKWLLQYTSFGIYLVYPNKDATMLHYLGTAPVKFNEYKKEIIFDALVEFLGIEEDLKSV